MKLNLGCGRDILPGWENIDLVDMSENVRQHDLNKGIPYKSNSFEEIKAFHILEHLKDKVYIFEEMWRVGKNACVIQIKVPDYRHENAYIDPSHVSLWHVKTVEYFKPKHPYSYISIAKFNILEAKTDGEEIYWMLEVINERSKRG